MAFSDNSGIRNSIKKKKNPAKILILISFLGMLFLFSCINLDISPYDTYNGEILGWLAIAATPDRPAITKNPMIRYTNQSGASDSYNLSADACGTVLPGSSILRLASGSTSSYLSIPEGSFNIWAACGACTKSTTLFAMNRTYTITAGAGCGSFTVTSP